MKTAKIILVIALAAIALVAYKHLRDTQPLETEHFENYEAEFRKEIDILKKNQDTMKRSLNRLEKNVDTLKTGQGVIYKTLKEGATKKSFINEILKEF